MHGYYFKFRRGDFRGGLHAVHKDCLGQVDVPTGMYLEALGFNELADEEAHLMLPCSVCSGVVSFWMGPQWVT